MSTERSGYNFRTSRRIGYLLDPSGDESNIIPQNIVVIMKAEVRFILHYSVCVCVFSSHSFWTSSSLDVPAGVTQEESHTGFLIHLLSAVRALIFLAKRIQPFLSLVDREVEFCILTI